jgi:hypothetical protein
MHAGASDTRRVETAPGYASTAQAKQLTEGRLTRDPDQTQQKGGQTTSDSGKGIISRKDSVD